VSARTEKRFTLEDVAVGEVWLAGGQSNMEFLLRDDAESAEEHAVDLPNVRCYEVPKIAYEGQQNDRDYSKVGFGERRKS
jgi:sialate O-acetylesterase